MKNISEAFALIFSFTLAFAPNAMSQWVRTDVTIDSAVECLVVSGSSLFAVQRMGFTALISLSPNPTTGIITVHNAPANMMHVTITNVLGQSVSEVTNSGAADFTIDLSKLLPGTYFAKFSSAGEGYYAEDNKRVRAIIFPEKFREGLKMCYISTEILCCATPENPVRYAKSAFYTPK